MRLGIKGKQVAGVVSVVGLAVIVLSGVHLSSLARVYLQASQARGDLLANAIFHRARAVVAGRSDPALALRADPGTRAMLESSIYSKDVTYAALVDVAGVAIAHSDPAREGHPVPLRSDLAALLRRSGFSQLRAIYSDEGQTFEVRQPLLLGNARFGSIRIGVSTLLIRRELDRALQPAAVTASVALIVATAVALLFAQLLLRPIHVIRSGLTRLGRGEVGVTLDLPQQDEFGEIGVFFNTMSAQLSAERSQRDGQAMKIESVVEHLEDAVAIVNPSGELLFANSAMRATLPPDPFGRPVAEVLPAGHPYRELVEQTLASRQSRGPVVARIPRAPAAGDAARDGSEQRSVMTHAIAGVDRRLVGVMLVARDLEYLGRVQSTINYSRKLAALGRLSAGVAHEVKNPLNAMTIHLELLKQKLSGARALTPAGRAASGLLSAADVEPPVSPPPDALSHVAVIAEEIRRLDRVVQGFLKFTRPEDLHLEPVLVSSLIDDLIRVVTPEAQKAGVTLHAECSPQVPDLNGDPGMLRQAFLNLALNACQAMPNGGTLRIGCAAAGGRVAVSFEDTGVGIKPEHLEKIFDLYFTTKKDGSGIGLSMVYRIVQLHDGEVEVQSTSGRGTTFRLLFPQG